MDSMENKDIEQHNTTTKEPKEGYSWYSLKVISGKERKIEENIMYEAESSGIKEDIDEVFVPYEKIIQLKNNKKQIKEKMFFPGYILINMRLTKQSKYVIENTTGVMCFVGPKGGDPVPLRDVEVKRIFGEVERKVGTEVMVTPFKKNDYVKVIAGPFIDFSGTVDEVNDEKQKVKIVISIFGRPTLVELDYLQVEMAK